MPLLATFGLAIVIENVIFQQFGADTRSLAPSIDDAGLDSWAIGDIYIGQISVLIFAVAVALLGSLSLFLSRRPISGGRSAPQRRIPTRSA